MHRKGSGPVSRPEKSTTRPSTILPGRGGLWPRTPLRGHARLAVWKLNGEVCRRRLPVSAGPPAAVSDRVGAMQLS